MPKKMRLAHLAGPNATITNSPPLVTSNKARARYNLPLMTDVEGRPSRFDVLRPQRLAAPATVYIEQFTAQPLESDSADLSGPPDGYLDAGGHFSETLRHDSDRPVYKVEIGPDDGYYPMPFMGRQTDGSAWEMDGIAGGAPREQTRQPFAPDGSRVFEEIDRLGVSRHGHGCLVSDRAEVDFYRIAPSGGYIKGLDEARRTDVGSGPIQPERPGKDFFPYRPRHLRSSPTRMALARITNLTQKILASGQYDSAIWTQGSPSIEETVYWFNLVLDVTIPICGVAAQRYQGMISNDGPKNITDSIDYVCSRVWDDGTGRNRVGVVMVQDQQIFAARDVMKSDARPGGYIATGGHGGILGTAGGGGGVVLRYLPLTKHTHLSDVNVSRLPDAVDGIALHASSRTTVPVQVKTEAGELLETAIPKVSIVKDTSYCEDNYDGDPSEEVDIAALIDYKLRKSPLSGFVLEGSSPYGRPASLSRANALARAVHLGFPVVYSGRGNTNGFAEGTSLIISGSNLTSTKARLLLMACIMRFGMLPPASDPDRPTRQEIKAIEARVSEYQAVFDTH
jgi:L-asparaginase